MKKTLHSKEYLRLTAWLKEERLNQGLTIRQLADKLHVSHSFIGKVEQCERRLDVIEYMHYSNILGISAAEGLRIAKGRKRG